MNKISVQSLNECFNVDGPSYIDWKPEWNKKLAYSGAEPWSKGKKLGPNPDHSEFMKTFPRSSESNEKRRQTMLGKNTGARSEETKRKISEALKGKKYKKRSEEHCKKISERMMGNDYGSMRVNTKHTEETKRKISDAKRKD